jgi:hypothetical protein
MVGIVVLVRGYQVLTAVFVPLVGLIFAQMVLVMLAVDLFWLLN